MNLNTLRVLYEFGLHHVNDYQTGKGHLLVLGPNPVLKIGAFSGTLPLSYDRTSGIVANHGFDSAKYVLHDPEESEKFQAFWDKQVETFPARKALLAKTREALEQRKLTVEGDPLKADQGWIVLVDAKGKILFEDPEFKAWWQDNAGAALTETMDEECHCWITGELCHPLQIHPKSSGVPNAGKASLMAYQYAEYTMNGQKRGATRGANFPLSPKAGRALKAGLDYALERVEKKLRYSLKMPSTNGDEMDANRVLLFIPGDRSESPFLRKYLPLLDRYTSQEDALPLWNALDEEEESSDVVHLILLKGSKGRIALLEHQAVTEGHLLERLRVLRACSKDDWADSFSKTLIQFVAGSSTDGHRPLIPYVWQTQAVWSFLLGEELPLVIRNSVILRNQFTRAHTLWAQHITGPLHV